MKIKILVCLAFFALISCSGDDSATPVDPENPNTNIPENPDPETPDLGTKDIKKISEFSSFYSSFTIPQSVIICDHNRPVSLTLYNQDQTVYMRQNYEYENGLLTVVYHYEEDGDYIETLEYDQSGRLIKKSDDDFFEFGSKSIYTYNPDNTINHQHQPGGMYYDLFYLNSMGQIYRMDESWDSGYTEAIFEGNNILSTIDHTYYGSTTTTNYTYDYTTEVKGEFLNIYKNMFGSNANMVLYSSDYYRALQYSDNYILQETQQNSSAALYTYAYEFDAEGYPVKKKRYFMGELQGETRIEYYQ